MLQPKEGEFVGWRGRRVWIIETYEIQLMAMVVVATLYNESPFPIRFLWRHSSLSIHNQPIRTQSPHRTSPTSYQHSRTLATITIPLSFCLLHRILNAFLHRRPRPALGLPPALRIIRRSAEAPLRNHPAVPELVLQPCAAINFGSSKFARWNMNVSQRNL